jgi:hypothetical protein
MERFSRKAHPVLQLVIFSFFTLNILLIVSSFKLSAAADQSKQAGWRLEVKEGKSARSTLTINNRCSEPHRFRIKSSVKYLQFEQPTDSVLIAASSNTQLGVRFDATGLKSKVYRGKVIVECLDCRKKGSKCTQDRDELPFEMTVNKSSIPARQTPSEYKAILVKIDQVDQRNGTIGISSLVTPTASRLGGTEGLMEAKARRDGRNLIIEFTGPLPSNSRKLMIVSNLPLRDVGEDSCMVEAGSYDIGSSRAGMKSVKLSLTVAPSMAAKHKKKPSRNIG